MQERITRFVTTHSTIAAERFETLMMNTSELVTDVGTVLDGPSAVEEGIIDELGSLADAFQCLYRMVEMDRKQKQDYAHSKDGSQDHGSKKSKTTADQ